MAIRYVFSHEMPCFPGLVLHIFLFLKEMRENWRLNKAKSLFENPDRKKYRNFGNYAYSAIKA